MDTLGRLLASFNKGDHFVLPCLLFCTPSWHGKEFYAKRKEFAPWGAKLFHFGKELGLQECK